MVCFYQIVFEDCDGFVDGVVFWNIVVDIVVIVFEIGEYLLCGSVCVFVEV